jgi:hypothetical protein
MQHMPDNVSTLKRRIDEAEQIGEVVPVLEVLAPLLAENASSRELYHSVIFSAHSLHFKRERREEAKRESNLFAAWRNFCRQKRHEEATVETNTHCNNHPFVPK